MERMKLKKQLYILALALVFVILLLLYFLGGKPSALGVFKNGSFGEQVKLDSSFTYASAKYSGGVAVFGKEGVFGITNGGSKAWQVPFTVSDPVLAASGKYVLAAERAGKRVSLISGGKVRYEMEADGEIITASVNKKGTFAVVMRERGFKGLVKVYNSRGKELFAWHSAEQNILSVALSEDSRRIAVSIVNMKDLSKMTSVLCFDLKNTIPVTMDVGDENLASGLVFNRNDLIAVGDEALYCFKKDGTEKFRIDYQGKELHRYSIYAGGTLCVVYRGADNGGGSTTAFYDGNGQLKGEAAILGNVTAMDTFGKYAAVSTQNTLYVINHGGKVVSAREIENSAARIFLCGSRNRLFMISGAHAGMYIF